MIMSEDKNLFDCVVVHYDEIGLKGNNRKMFEDLLVTNMKKKLGSLATSFRKEHGLIVVYPSKASGRQDIAEALSKVPGIAYFSFAIRSSRDMDCVSKCVIDYLASKEFETFRIYARRHDKDFPMNSLEINKKLGADVVEVYHKKAKMVGADMIVKVEVSSRSVYISSENIRSVGGLPTNSKQKVVSLLSGGFDSPVASYMMMKRGCEVILVHFQNENQMACSVEDKIVRIAKQLSKFQVVTKLYIVPFEELQKRIIMYAQADIRMLVYRRFMLKISLRIARDNQAKFLVVGDSLSQVASQTFDNLYTTYQNCEMPVFSPLIGMNKTEIIDISRNIGTYDISKLPYGDCCSYFLPKHPRLKSYPKQLDGIESRFEDIDALVDDAVKRARVTVY